MVHPVQANRTFRDPADPDTDVEPKNRLHGFKFGRSRVPIVEDADEASLKYVWPVQQLALIGFAKMTDVKREFRLAKYPRLPTCRRELHEQRRDILAPAWAARSRCCL